MVEAAGTLGETNGGVNAKGRAFATAADKAIRRACFAFR
jgi:hypothetical protein